MSELPAQCGAVAMLHGVDWPGCSSLSLFVPLNIRTIEPSGLNLWRRESDITSDCNHQPASDRCGPYVEHSTQRVWDGVELRNACEMAQK